MKVPIIVLNDGWLSLLKVRQERKGYDLTGVRLGDQVTSPPPHYFGVPCRSANNTSELAKALKWGLNLGGPSIVEAFIDAESYSITVYD